MTGRDADVPAAPDGEPLRIDPWDDPPLDAGAAGWTDDADGPPAGAARADRAPEAGANFLDVLPPDTSDDGEDPDLHRKVPRHLHLWLAGALALLTLAALGVQSWLTRANAPSGPATAGAPPDPEPPMVNLQRELARQRGEPGAAGSPLGALPARVPASAGQVPLAAAPSSVVAGALHGGSDPLVTLAAAPSAWPRTVANSAGTPPASVAAAGTLPAGSAAPLAAVTALGAADDGSLPPGLAPPAGSDGPPADLRGGAGGEAAYEQARAQAVIAGSRILALSHAPVLSAEAEGTLAGAPSGPAAGRSQLLASLLHAAPELVRSFPELAGAVRESLSGTPARSAAAVPPGVAGPAGAAGTAGADPAARPGLPARSAEDSLHPSAADGLPLILEGTPIACVLQTEVRSDLPGMIVAQVAEDVYDSVTAQRRLLPRGTRLVGRYDSQVAGGQQRLMASFHRLILPGGASVELQHLDAADAAGSAGLQDQVDTHFWQRFGQSFLTAGLARAAQRDGAPTTVGTSAGVLPGPDATGQILVDTARTSLQAGATQAPTLIIRRGMLFNVMVNRDLHLPELETP